MNMSSPSLGLRVSGETETDTGGRYPNSTNSLAQTSTTTERTDYRYADEDACGPVAVWWMHIGRGGADGVQQVSSTVVPLGYSLARAGRPFSLTSTADATAEGARAVTEEAPTTSATRAPIVR